MVAVTGSLLSKTTNLDMGWAPAVKREVSIKWDYSILAAYVHKHTSTHTCTYMHMHTYTCTHTLPPHRYTHSFTSRNLLTLIHEALYSRQTAITWASLKDIGGSTSR